jgi:DNA-binding beta-propeller fold protein YncE
LLAGCAGNRPADRPGAGPDQGAAAPSAGQSSTLMYWDEIDSGVEGDIFTGVKNIRLQRPTAVAARSNFVFIYDSGTFRLYRYDMAMRRLKELRDLSGLVTGDVDSIYVEPDLSVYVADTYGGRVLYFDARGNLLRTLGDRLNLVHPVGVRVDESDGRVLVADGSNDFILEFDRLGNIHRGIGSRGLDEGQFLNITAMDVHRHDVYVTARFGHRIQVLDERGRFVRDIDSTVRFPTAIAVDQDDRVYVAEYEDNTIKIFSKDGKLIDTVGGTGVGPGRFKRIAGLWVDEGFLYVADSLNGRVQIMRIAN